MAGKFEHTALARSRSIDNQLDEAREQRLNEVQLLIIGSAGSGKSTFTKQLRILHGDGFPDEERNRLQPLIIDNTCDAIFYLMKSIEKANIPMSATYKKLCSDYVKPNENQPCGPIMENIIDLGIQRPLMDKSLLKSLWQTPEIQESFKRRKEFQLPRTYEYFLERIDTLLSPDYIPSLQDILFIRKPTLSIQEHLFSVDGMIYRVIDVAGQRSQRKKWIHFFEGVTAVIFFASLSGYCEKMDEDPETNSLVDSLQLFKEITHNPFLDKTDVILFLNKKDVFSEKLKFKKLNSCFPDYKGDNSLEDAIQYIRDEFIKRKPTRKVVYPHICNATDMDLMKSIIINVMQIIIEINLKKSSPF